MESARGEIPNPGTDDLDGMSYAEISQVIVDVLPVSARTLAEPGYRAMLAQVFGSSVTHPGVMAAFWQNHILPRRRTAPDATPRTSRCRAPSRRGCCRRRQTSRRSST